MCNCEKTVEKTEFDEGTFLETGVLYCVLCLETSITPKKAITISGGHATCEEHFSYFKNDSVAYYRTEYFRRLREANTESD